MIAAQLQDKLKKERLAKLLKEQIEESERGAYNDISYINLLEDFKKSKRFMEAFKELLGYFLTMNCFNGKHDKIINEFTGRLYQDISYLFFSKKKISSSLILSPERTLNFYERLHPYSRKLIRRFGLDSLEGISVPDGLLISNPEEEPSIQAVCEYTLKRDRGNFQNKCDSLEIDKRKFKNLFEGSYVFFGLPNHLNLNVPEQARFETLPFTHKEFGDFINDIYMNYRPDDIEDFATLLDIQRATTERLDKLKENFRNNSPSTEECRNYLLKVENSLSYVI